MIGDDLCYSEDKVQSHVPCSGVCLTVNVTTESGHTAGKQSYYELSLRLFFGSVCYAFGCAQPIRSETLCWLPIAANANRSKQLRPQILLQLLFATASIFHPKSKKSQLRRKTTASLKRSRSDEDGKRLSNLPYCSFKNVRAILLLSRRFLQWSTASETELQTPSS